VRALRAVGAAERAALAGLAVALALFLLHRTFQGFFVLPRFALFALGALVPAFAIGLEGALAAALPRARRRRSAHSAPASGFTAPRDPSSRCCSRALRR
jgi:hypothetical protein